MELPLADVVLSGAAWSGGRHGPCMSRCVRTAASSFACLLVFTVVAVSVVALAVRVVGGRGCAAGFGRIVVA